MQATPQRGGSQGLGPYPRANQGFKDGFMDGTASATIAGQALGARSPMHPPLVTHSCELLAGAGPCVARRMFGGWGLSVEGLNIALIAFDTLYLKVDAQTEATFAAAGGQPFRYEAKGRMMSLHYLTPPEEALDSPALMAPWARLALQAALRAHAAKPATKTTRPPRKGSARPPSDPST